MRRQGLCILCINITALQAADASVCPRWRMYFMKWWNSRHVGHIGGGDHPSTGTPYFGRDVPPLMQTTRAHLTEINLAELVYRL